MTLGPIDDPIEAVVTETLGQAVKRQAAKIERLRRLLADGVDIATTDSPYHHGTRVRLREWAAVARGELGDMGL